METGKVKFYNKEKKYGFITGDDGKDYFFHASGVSNDIYLKDGDNVEFKVVDGEKRSKSSRYIACLNFCLFQKSPLKGVFFRKTI